MIDVKRNLVDPWKPSRMGAIVVFLSPLAAALLAWNWRRLNKRAWFAPAMALALLPAPILIVIGLTLLGAADAGGSDLDFWLGFAPLMMAGGWGYGIVGAQWYLQGPAWQQYQEKPDWEGLASYEYPVRNAALILVGAAVGFPALVALFVMMG